MNRQADLDVLQHIKSFYPELSQVEKRIADTIEVKLEHIPDMTVTELAEQSDVSDASVIRFAKKIGYEGFYQMKIQIIRSFYHEGKDNSQPNETATLPEQIADIITSNIKNCFNSIDMEAVQKTVELIKTSKNIFFFAAGNSLTIAQDASYKLGKLGYRSFCETIPERSLLQARNMQKGDLACAVSRSGSSQLVVQALHIVKRKGIPSVIISNYTKSPCAALGSILLLTSSYRSLYPGETVQTRIAEMALVDLIYYMVLGSCSDYVRKQLTESESDQSLFSL